MPRKRGYGEQARPVIQWFRCIREKAEKQTESRKGQMANPGEYVNPAVQNRSMQGKSFHGSRHCAIPESCVCSKHVLHRAEAHTRRAQVTGPKKEWSEARSKNAP